MIVSPDATRNSAEALASPFRNWMTRESMRQPAHGRGGARAAPTGMTVSGLSLRTQATDLVVGRQVVLAVGIAPVDHRATPVGEPELADEAAERRLMVDRAELDAAERAGK